MFLWFLYGYFFPLCGIAYGISLILPYLLGTNTRAALEDGLPPMTHTEERLAKLITYPPTVLCPDFLEMARQQDLVKLVYIGRFVIDATDLVQAHPGGSEVIKNALFTDATEALERAGHSSHNLLVLSTLVVGVRLPT